MVWTTPTRETDVLPVESQVVEITPSRSKPDRGLLLLESRPKTSMTKSAKG